MWWMFAAWADCPEDPAAELRSRTSALEAAYDDVDEEGFAYNYELVHELVPCLTVELDKKTIVAWHRARGLGEFFEREEIASAKSWAAVKEIDPEFRLPDSWLVEGTPLHRAWTEAPQSEETLKLERSPLGGWKVDGEEAKAVPAHRAFVLQGFDAGGRVIHANYHYSIAEVPVVDFGALDTTARERRRKRIRTGGTVLAGAMGVGALGTFGAAFGHELTTKSRNTPLEDVERHAQTSNTLSWVGAGLGAGSLAVGTVAWAVPW